VFSLGCIAYYIFTGKPPAESTLELSEKLRVGQGLRLSDTMDGCGARQQDLIQFATAPTCSRVTTRSRAFWMTWIWSKTS
jgi:hypothetical protein